MSRKTYAQIDANGIVIGALDTDGTITAPHMIEAPDAFARLGHRWNGTAWEIPAPDAKAQARAELASIDAATGMSRTLRETLIAIGGANVPQILKDRETRAAQLRAVLAS